PDPGEGPTTSPTSPRSAAPATPQHAHPHRRMGTGRQPQPTRRTPAQTPRPTHHRRSPPTRPATTESRVMSGVSGLAVLGVGAGAAARALVEDDLAQADVVGRHLDALVFGDELEGLLERHR